MSPRQRSLAQEAEMFAASTRFAVAPLRFGVSRLIRLGRKTAGLVIEAESLPDHLKRDLGLLDGRTAPPRDPLRD
jgi:hypothetical protein